jgi:Sedlin, N-terminal conserved region
VRRVHDAFVQVVFNPFYNVSENARITSKRFDREVETIGREWKVSG